MLKKGLLVAAIAVSFFVTPTYAVVPDEDSAVSQNFRSFGRDLRSIGRMSDQGELVTLLEKIHAAVTANRSEVPSFMEAGTDLYAEYQDGIDEFLAEAADDSPNGRIAEPGEVASLVLYLASDAARHITGTAISIDGGATA